VRKADNLPPSCAVVTKSGKINFLEHSGTVQACIGTALSFYPLYGSETWTVKASDVRRITATEMKYMRRTAGYTWDRLQNKCTNCKGVKNYTNFGQITGNARVAGYNM